VWDLDDDLFVVLVLDDEVIVAVFLARVSNQGHAAQLENGRFRRADPFHSLGDSLRWSELAQRSDRGLLPVDRYRPGLRVESDLHIPSLGPT
jgi:hypothetical protein